MFARKNIGIALADHRMTIWKIKLGRHFLADQNKTRLSILEVDRVWHMIQERSKQKPTILEYRVKRLTVAGVLVQGEHLCFAVELIDRRLVVILDHGNFVPGFVE
jgi:hypothetical protein